MRIFRWYIYDTKKIRILQPSLAILGDFCKVAQAEGVNISLYAQLLGVKHQNTTGFLVVMH